MSSTDLAGIIAILACALTVAVGIVVAEKAPANWRRPTRFTIRELLVLVATQRPEEQLPYLQTTFGWFQGRSSAQRGSLPAAITFGIGLALGGTPYAVAAVAAAAFALVVYLTMGRVLLSPLHREYQLCLALLPRLQGYSEELAAAFAVPAQRWHEPSTHGSWFQRHPFDQGKTVERALTELHRAFCEKPLCRRIVDDQDIGRAALVGRYLFEVLGPVPTDEYERRLRVRRKVDELLDGAATLPFDR